MQALLLEELLNDPASSDLKEGEVSSNAKCLWQKVQVSDICTTASMGSSGDVYFH